jgi:hypothetical protein
MQQTVTFPAGDVPNWPAVRDVLSGAGFPARMMMVDGELAFPDEEPPPAWREVRVGTPQGMVTVRRGPGGVELVTWGNADVPLRQAWNAVAWAFAAAGHGRVETLSADEFLCTAELPDVLRR